MAEPWKKEDLHKAIRHQNWGLTAGASAKLLFRTPEDVNYARERLKRGTANIPIVIEDEGGVKMRKLQGLIWYSLSA